ncbi:MAG: MCE family protein [Flavobacteriaceae bacterium]|nr:MCE family protein [Bacteroidia bacterium]NNK87933.1 MCE family protein [Flavobacteriaceae bacterium]
MAISREVKTAVLVIAGLLLIIFLFNYLKGENLLDSSRKFYAEFDNVEGLETSAPVTINGFQVGRVQEINFMNEKSGKLRVMLLLENDFKFSKNSEAQLYENGLIGGKAIAILPAFDGDAVAETGMTLSSSLKPGLSDLLNQKLTPLQEKIEKVMVSADSLITNINAVFDEQTKSNLRSSIAELNTTIVSFRKTSGSINAMVTDNKDKLENTLANIDQISTNLSSITDSIASADLAATINNLEKTIGKFDTMLTSIENGDGSIGKLLKDEGLYNNLEGASAQLEQLLQDMKLNPKRYVHFSIFGKRPGDYDAGANEEKDIDEQNDNKE